MKADLLLRERIVIGEEAFVEMVVWRVPSRVLGSDHEYKFRLACVVNHRCVLRFDNEAGKGDHYHRDSGSSDTISNPWTGCWRTFGGWSMNTLTIQISDRETAGRRFKAAMAGQPQGEFLSFASLDLLHKVLNPRRWRILQYLQKYGPMRLRALARELAMDAGNLQKDVKVLKEYGLIEETGEGLTVPYDEIRMEVVIRKVA